MNTVNNKSSNNKSSNMTNNIAPQKNQSNTTKNTPMISQPISQMIGYSKTNIVGIILLVVVIIAVCGASYWLYNFYVSKNTFAQVALEAMPDIKDAQSTTSISANTIPNSSYSNEYSISFWINVQDFNYNYGKEKTILRRGDAGSGNPEIVLGAKKNDIIVRLKLQGTVLNNIVQGNAVSNFLDIPIQLQTTLKEPQDLNIDESVLDSEVFAKLGSNNIDFPTLQYISAANETSVIGQADKSPSDLRNYDQSDKYFSLISGNEIHNIKEAFASGDATDTTNTTMPSTTSSIPSTTSSTSSMPSTTPPNIVNATSIFDNSMYRDPTVGECSAKMIPLQKWVNVIVSVYNQIIDIYIDGQLTSSCILKSFPAVSTADINITPDGGFAGQIGRISFFNTAMTVKQSQSIYNAGPVSSSSIIDMIPNWVYWGIILIIVAAIAYSFFA